MNHDPTVFERMIDQWGRPLEWRGRWRVREGALNADIAGGPVLPATFPRTYYKAGARG